MKIDYDWDTDIDKYYDDNDNEISKEEYNQLVRIEELKKEREEKRRCLQIELSQVGSDIRKLNTETFHSLLIKYKETKEQYYYDAISVILERMTRRLADKYIKKGLPLRARQMFLCDSNADDYTEYLTVILMTAIDKWQPNTPSKDGNTLVVKFRTYYEVLVKNWAAHILEKYNSQYAQKVTEIVSIDNTYADKLLEEISKHCIYTETDKIEFNVLLQEFMEILRNIDSQLPSLFSLLICGRYTHATIAKILGCSTKTIQRKLKIIQKKWIEFNTPYQV